MRKRILAAILSICMVLAMLPVTAFAEEAVGDVSGSCGADVTWALAEDGTLTISGSGAMENYKMGDWIPSTNVETPWYGSREKITRIVVEDEVTSIGEYAFCGCINAAEIVLPERMEEIGMAAFRECSQVSCIKIPSGVSIIERSTFLRCSGLQEIAIPDSVTEISAYAFSGCSSLQKAVIPDGVTRIEISVFEDCSSLQEVVIPDTVTEIKGTAFSNCSSLPKIIIPKSVTKIGAFAFESCTGLQEVVIPDSVTEIGMDAFLCCSSLQEIVIPEGISKIESGTFMGCSSLQEIIIPESVTEIGESAFSSCTKLRKAVLPSGVTIIESNLFNLCSSLQEIIISENVTKIGAYAFKGCSNLQEVSISKNVTLIGMFAFYGCDSLNQLLVPASVTTIGKSAFPVSRNFSLVGAEGSATDTYAAQNDLKFMAHAHEWDDGDKSNLSCANNKVPYTCTVCSAVEEREMAVAHSKIIPAENLDNICAGDGSVIYYQCTLCGGYFSDKSGSTEISREEIEIAAAHELFKVEEVQATCESEGSIAHFKCGSCGKLFRDADAIEEITANDIVTGILAHDMVKTEEVQAACESGGSIAYYRCGSCGKIFRDVKGLEEITLDDISTEKLGHSVVKVDAKPESCESEGSVAHYKCERCGELYRDAGGLEEITSDDIGVEKLGHNLVKVDAKAESCEKDGNIEYYRCGSCGKLFRDADGLDEITAENTVVKAMGHSLWCVEAKAAACTRGGNIEYFYCDTCDKKFRDAYGKEQIFDVTVGALGHKYVTKTQKATLSSNGGVEKACKNCGHKITVSTFYKIGTVKLSKTTYRYTGKARLPKVTVKDSKGKTISASDYTVSYSNKKSKNVGKYTVTVTFTGTKYSGRKILNYTIMPANVSLKSVSSNDNGQLAVKWGAKKGIDGYQVRYSGKSSMKGSKTKTVKGAEKKQFTVNKLAKGKKYYVQVRGYKKDSGKTYYGAWSKKKSAKTLNMKLNYKSLSMEPGQAKTLKLIGAKQSVRWNTSNPAVAGVTSAGKVTAIADGTATITAICGNSSYSCKVKVKTVTNFDKLYNYLNRYGNYDSSGNPYINYSFYVANGELWKIGFMYNKGKGQFGFYCFDPDNAATALYMGRNGSATVKCEFVCNSYFGSCLALADLDVPSYSVNSTLSYNITRYYGGTWEEYNKLANLELLLSMKFWDLYLEKNLGFGMSGLGFTSY